MQSSMQKRQKKSNNRLKLANNILNKEVNVGKRFMSIREKELDESRWNLFQEFNSGKESLLKEQSEKMQKLEEMLIANEQRENELKRASEAEKERSKEFKALMEKITVSWMLSNIDSSYDYYYLGRERERVIEYSN